MDFSHESVIENLMSSIAFIWGLTYYIYTHKILRGWGVYCRSTEYYLSHFVSKANEVFELEIKLLHVVFVHKRSLIF